MRSRWQRFVTWFCTGGYFLTGAIALYECWHRYKITKPQEHQWVASPW
jgi:hypothetical protein